MTFLLRSFAFYSRRLRSVRRRDALLNLDLVLGALLSLGAEDVDVPLGRVADGDVLQDERVSIGIGREERGGNIRSA